MRYISTRGGGGSCDFEQAVLRGLAPDGGLYVPESFPAFSGEELKAMADLPYRELACKVMAPFVAPCLSPEELKALVDESYAGFDVPEVAPLVKLDDGFMLLELFHGPTLAFKDIALQLLGRIFGHFATKRGGGLTVLGATSGDTGSAAIAGCGGIKGVRVIILYPHERPSEIQRRQMTTVDAPNVHVVAVQGAFDDCQAMVKHAFGDETLRARCNLTAVNSINWARIIAQTVYYIHAGLRAGALEKPVSFVVPSGNFGNIYAGHVAGRLGLPLHRLVAATNRNDSLAQFIRAGLLKPGPVVPSLSPSMDIQVPGNLERYLFGILDRKGGAVTEALEAAKSPEGYRLPAELLQKMQAEFMADTASDRQTNDAIAAAKTMSGQTIDPHTAVGFHAAMGLTGNLPGAVIALACAHPAKFPETVRGVLRAPPPVPARIQGLKKKRERFTILPKNPEALRTYIFSHMPAS